MSDILIRGLDTKTVKRLKDRARRHGRSLQSEAKLLLESAADVTIAEILASAQTMRQKLGRRFSDSAAMIREDRNR